MIAPAARIAVLASVLAGFAGSVGCKKSEERRRVDRPDESGSARTVSAPARRPEGAYGKVRGTVKLSGAVLEMPMIRNGSDPICAQTKLRAETILVNDNATLKNALVRVKPGTVPGWVPSEPVAIKQVNCMYRPRVQGGVAGQQLTVSNTDDTSHNVHVRGGQIGDRQGAKALWNRQQLKASSGSSPIAASVEDIPVMRIKCDVHGWMSGYVVVSDNPYHAVTDETGSAELETPVGDLTVQAWHEFYGLKEATVTVEAGKTSEIVFSFDADADNPTGARTAPSESAPKGS